MHSGRLVHSKFASFEYCCIQANLFNQHFVYDLNLSGVGCHCNAAGYFIKMPSPYGPGESNDYYCDANYVGGIG